MGKGTAIIDIAVDTLGIALAIMPSTYKVIGSGVSIAPDTVRLIVTSDDLTLDKQVHITCEVRDVGSQRTVLMKPVEQHQYQWSEPNW